MRQTSWMTWLIAVPATALFAVAGRTEPTDTSGPEGSVTPIVNYVAVDGDERKFREDRWMKDQWSGGIEQLTLEQDLDQHTVLRVEGRGLFDADDYRLRLEVVRYFVGFIRAGYTQNRTYYDDSG